MACGGYQAMTYSSGLTLAPMSQDAQKVTTVVSCRITLRLTSQITMIHDL
jgi:hypothetical protein